MVIWNDDDLISNSSSRERYLPLDGVDIASLEVRYFLLDSKSESYLHLIEIRQRIEARTTKTDTARGPYVSTFTYAKSDAAADKRGEGNGIDSHRCR